MIVDKSARKPSRPNPHTQRRRAGDLARDAFLRAAAALTEPITAGVVAFALLEASIGLLRLAECDDDEQSGRARVEDRLRAELQRKAQTVPAAMAHQGDERKDGNG